MKYRNHHAGCCGLNPTRGDGSEWAHVMLLHDGSTVHADTAAEVLGELLPGYERLDEPRRASARRRHALRLAATAQEARIAGAAAQGTLDPEDPDAADLLELLRADKATPILLEDADAPGAPAPWLGEPDLVLVSTTYAPHTDAPPVTGNVTWLDPSGEDAYLASLHAARLFSYWRAEPSAD